MTTAVTHQNSRSESVTTAVTHDHPATVTDLDSRRSHETGKPKVSCPQWFNSYIADLQAAGHTTTTAFAAIEAGMAQGYAKGLIRQAASNHPDVHTIDRKGGTATWSITGGRAAKLVSAAEWTANYIDGLDRDSITVVDKDTFRKAGEAAGYSWTSLRHAATDSGRIRSIPSTGSETIWQIQTEETA